MSGVRVAARKHFFPMSALVRRLAKKEASRFIWRDGGERTKSVECATAYRRLLSKRQPMIQAAPDGRNVRVRCPSSLRLLSCCSAPPALSNHRRQNNILFVGHCQLLRGRSDVASWSPARIANRAS